MNGPKIDILRLIHHNLCSFYREHEKNTDSIEVVNEYRDRERKKPRAGEKTHTQIHGK